MPPASKTQHRVISNTALAYVTNSSPTSTDPQYTAGLNLLTSLKGFTERRPGFASTVENVASTFVNLKRIFVWQRWDDPASGATRGAYIVMFNDVTPSGSKVYKLQLGTDESAVLIHTDSASQNVFFFVNSNNECYFGNSTADNMKRYDASTVYKWGILAPTIAPTFTLTGTGISAAAGYFYLQTFGQGDGTGINATDVRESSPGPLSVSTGVFTNKQVNVTITASSDPQVNQIHVYRTTDGGSTDPTQMREISGSPFANVNATIVDTTIDDDLSIEVAPASLRNDPPTDSYPDCWYAGRIWTHINNALYYSGFEEIGRGVPEECFPGGLDGNVYPYDRQIIKVDSLDNGVAIFTPQRIYGIDGDSLDTFRRYTLLDRRGTQSPSSVISVGNSLCWLDTSSQVWLSDLGEISEPIRPDLQGINPATAYLTVHISQTFHWVVLLDGSRGLLFVFDLDTKQWMPPWQIGNSATCLTSAATAAGVVDLMIGRQGSKAVKLVPTQYNDDGTRYTAYGTTNQFNISPEQAPDWRGILDWIEIKRNAIPLYRMSQLTDDSPSSPAFVANEVLPAPTVTQGTLIKTDRGTVQVRDQIKTCQLASVKFEWIADNNNFQLYQISVASHPSGT